MFNVNNKQKLHFVQILFINDWFMIDDDDDGSVWSDASDIWRGKE